MFNSFPKTSRYKQPSEWDMTLRKYERGDAAEKATPTVGAILRAVIGGYGAHDFVR